MVALRTGAVEVAEYTDLLSGIAATGVHTFAVGALHNYQGHFVALASEADALAFEVAALAFEAAALAFEVAVLASEVDALAFEVADSAFEEVALASEENALASVVVALASVVVAPASEAKGTHQIPTVEHPLEVVGTVVAWQVVVDCHMSGVVVVIVVEYTADFLHMMGVAVAVMGDYLPGRTSVAGLAIMMEQSLELKHKVVDSGEVVLVQLDIHCKALLGPVAADIQELGVHLLSTVCLSPLIHMVRTPPGNTMVVLGFDHRTVVNETLQSCPQHLGIPGYMLVGTEVPVDHMVVDLLSPFGWVPQGLLVLTQSCWVRQTWVHNSTKSKDFHLFG